MKKMVFLFISVLMLVTGCGDNSSGDNASSKEKVKEVFTPFKSKIIDYDVENTGSSNHYKSALVSVVINNKLHIFDAYENVKYDNELETIEGAYLYGEISSKGNIKNAIIKPK